VDEYTREERAFSYQATLVSMPSRTNCTARAASRTPSTRERTFAPVSPKL
jgi:hypothetical protein